MEMDAGDAPLMLKVPELGDPDQTYVAEPYEVLTVASSTYQLNWPSGSLKDIEVPVEFDLM